MGGENGKELTLSLIWLTFFGRGGGVIISGGVDIFPEGLTFFGRG